MRMKSFDVVASDTIWDWLYLECAKCRWRSGEMIRRGMPLRGPFSIGPCSCGSTIFVVLERREHPAHPSADVAPRALPVVS